jgi:monooxygenase
MNPPLDILIIGAGLSGIGAARHLQLKRPETRWLIVEARACLGGTWDLFRYPGIRSDSDMHTLGYDFKPWLARKAIADGPSILRYITETADEAGITPQIKFDHRVTRADWSTAEALWTVHFANGEQLQAKFIYACSGYYSYAQGYQPELAGQADYLGKLIYPQFWPADFDHAGKRIVVIGSGATAVTIVPEMAKTAAAVTMLQRSPTYVAALPSEDVIALALAKVLPSGLAYSVTRWKNVLLGLLRFHIARRYAPLFKKRLREMTAEALPAGYDMRHFSPSYEPWDQRLCVVPDGDLFAAISSGKARVLTDTVAQLTATGVTLGSGQHIEADAVVVATGLQMQLLGGLKVSVDGVALDASKHMAYKGMMLSDVPNFVLAFGYTNASWTLKADLTAGYVCRLLKHMEKHQVDIAVARRDPAVAEQNFLSFTSGYVQRAQAILPKQGVRKPWLVHQNYVADRFTIRYGRIDDGVLQFAKKPQT